MVHESLADILARIDDPATNLCILFGAGGSKYAGLPLMADLTQGILEAPGAGHLELRLDRIMANYRLRNIEDLLNLLISEYETLAAVKEPRDRVAAAISLIKEYIFEKVSTSGSPTAHIRFLKRIFATRTSAHIITTNYDLLIERALDELGIRYINGFAGGVDKRFDPTEFSREQAQRARGTEQLAFLYKVHGSIGWWYDRNANRIYESFRTKSPSKDINELLIYPSRAKATISNTEPFALVQKEMEESLRLPNTLLITIGYGWGDRHINQRLHTALETGIIVALMPDAGEYTLGLRVDPHMHIVTRDRWLLPKRDERVLASGESDLWQFERLVEYLDHLPHAPRLKTKDTQARGGESQRTQNRHLESEPFKRAQSSYMMVLTLIMLRGCNNRGRMQLPRVIDKFRSFYQDRRRRGLLVERSGCDMVNPDRDDEKLFQILKNGPIKALSKRYLYVDEAKDELGLVDELWLSPERFDALLLASQAALDNYYTSIQRQPTVLFCSTVRQTAASGFYVNI